MCLQQHQHSCFSLSVPIQAHRHLFKEDDSNSSFITYYPTVLVIFDITVVNSKYSTSECNAQMHSKYMSSEISYAVTTREFPAF